MITDDDIKEITELFIEVANDTGALSEVMDEYKERSLALKIHDSAYKTGFIFQNGKLRALRSLDRPTCLVTTDKNTFWKIINQDDPKLQQLQIYTAFLTEKSLSFRTEDGDIQIHSENLIKIFSNIAELAA